MTRLLIEHITKQRSSGLTPQNLAFSSQAEPSQNVSLAVVSLPQ